ncbi:MAG: SRPBCC family protein [Candidatus Melainabacteria bacterium]|nr:SRPBCC family protein [Candidatus Melainabacteria bacterium]
MKVTKSTLMFAVAAVVFQMPAFAAVTVEECVTIDAKPETVWKALHEYQKEDKAFHKKIVSSTPNSVTLKEEFAKMPIIGTTFLNYIEVSKPEEHRIEYRLTETGVVNKFDGAWIVEESKDGNGSTLKVVTTIDSWVPAPFKNKVLRSSTKKGMEKRLAYVKDYAEHHSVSN